MTSYLLLLLTVLLATGNNILLHAFDNKGMRPMGDIYLFNALSTASWFLLLLPLSDFSEINPDVIFWGILYGAVTGLFLLSKMQALANGPVSLTSFIGCSSLFLSTIFGTVFFQEKISFYQGIGMLILPLSLYMVSAPKNSHSKPSWKIWCALFFLANSLVGVIFKLHQASEVKNYISEMMLCASLISSVMFLCFARAASGKAPAHPPYLPKKALWTAILCGLISCLYNRLNIRLSGELPSVVFFPVFNGAVIFLSSLSGFLVFREKLKKAQISGILLGFIALLFVSGCVENLLNT